MGKTQVPTISLECYGAEMARYARGFRARFNVRNSSAKAKPVEEIWVTRQRALHLLRILRDIEKRLPESVTGIVALRSRGHTVIEVRGNKHLYWFHYTKFRQWLFHTEHTVRYTYKGYTYKERSEDNSVVHDIVHPHGAHFRLRDTLADQQCDIDLRPLRFIVEAGGALRGLAKAFQSGGVDTGIGFEFSEATEAWHLKVGCQLIDPHAMEWVRKQL